MISLQGLQNISEMRVLKIGQVRTVGEFLVKFMTEGRCRFVLLLVAVHEQHPQRDC